MIKIGITQRPKERMQELEAKCIWARVLCFDPRDKERKLHKKYSSKRLPGTEWFKIEPGREGVRGDKEFSELLKEVYLIGNEALELCIHYPNKSIPEHIKSLEDLVNQKERDEKLEGQLRQAEIKHKDDLKKLSDSSQEWERLAKSERARRVYLDSEIDDLRMHISALEGRLRSLGL